MAGRGALTSIALMCLGAARAVELLAPVKRYEAGWIDRYMAAHLRGQSYLTAHRGQDATLEFQKIVDHRGDCSNFYHRCSFSSRVGSRLDPARRYPEGPRRLRKLLQAWKDADRDVPVLAVAKSEYASFADYSSPRTVRWFGLFRRASIETLRSALRVSAPTSSSIYFPIGAS